MCHAASFEMGEQVKTGLIIDGVIAGLTAAMVAAFCRVLC